jgi:cellulose synthase operon protein B
MYSDFLSTGDNRLILQVNLQPANVCSTFVNHGAWFTASSASVLNIPLIPAIPGGITALANLSQYPLPFISTPTLNDVGFILSKDDSHSWRVASSLASQLGRRATGQLLTPQMAFSDELTNDFLNNHLIVIGIPANLPLIGQIADAMPAPFEPGSNIVTERTLTVEYRLPTDTSLGYIELFTSPWNIERLVLTILGSTSEGLEWAHNAMTVSSLRGRVTGNFVVVSHTQILSTDTRISNTTIVPGASPVLPEIQPETSPSVPDTISTGRPGWLFPSIIILSLLTAVTVVLVVINSLRQRKN